MVFFSICLALDIGVFDIGRGGCHAPLAFDTIAIIFARVSYSVGALWKLPGRVIS
jgi:hypothetical protein